MTSPHKLPLRLSCPQCKKTVLWNDQFPHRPFCSHRCQLIDMGEWAQERFVISDNPIVLDEGE